MKKLTALLLAAVIALTLPTAALAGSLSVKDALKIALNSAGLSKKQVVQVETERDRGIIEVEFVKKSNRAEYSFDIRARDGKIIEKSVEYAYKHNHSKAKIGKKAALNKVAKFSGFKLATVKNGSCIYEYHDREGKYEVKFHTKRYKYEYEVLAPTGKIIEWKRDLLKK